jgi:hypothetical protein
MDNDQKVNNCINTPQSKTFRSKVHTLSEQAGSSNASDFYLGGDRFESDPEHRIFWVRLFVDFVSSAKQMPDSMLNYVVADSLIILSDSLRLLAIMKSICCYAVCVTVSVTKQTINRYPYFVTIFIHENFLCSKTDQINSIVGKNRTWEGTEITY